MRVWIRKFAEEEEALLRKLISTMLQDPSGVASNFALYFFALRGGECRFGRVAPWTSEWFDLFSRATSKIHAFVAWIFKDSSFANMLQPFRLSKAITFSLRCGFATLLSRLPKVQSVHRHRHPDRGRKVICISLLYIYNNDDQLCCGRGKPCHIRGLVVARSSSLRQTGCGGSDPGRAKVSILRPFLLRHNIWSQQSSRGYGGQVGSGNWGSIQGSK